MKKLLYRTIDWNNFKIKLLFTADCCLLLLGFSFAKPIIQWIYEKQKNQPQKQK